MSTPTSHLPAGSPNGTGGQFASRPGTDSDVTLTGVGADPSDTARGTLSKALSRGDALQAAADRIAVVQARNAIRGIVAAVQTEDPQATAFQLKESDQPGSARMYVGAVASAATEPPEVEGWDAEDLAWNLQALPYEDVPGVSREGNDEQGFEATVNIAQVLAEPEVPEVPQTDRGAALLAQHAALYGTDVDQSDSATVRNVLSDVAAWADANGVQVDALWEAARAPRS